MPLEVLDKRDYALLYLYPAAICQAAVKSCHLHCCIPIFISFQVVHLRSLL